MNKQELIKHIEDLPYNEGLIVDTIKISRNGLLKLIEQLDEPQKVTIPQFVADWYENNKDYLEYNFQDWLKHLSEFRLSKNEQFGKWVNEPENNPAETLVKMKLFGYEVEQETRYYVRLKNVDKNYNYLNRINHLDAWCLTEIKTDKKFRTTHTRKQLEDAGFGEVFNSTLFEVEEVE